MRDEGMISVKSDFFPCFISNILSSYTLDFYFPIPLSVMLKKKLNNAIKYRSVPPSMILMPDAFPAKCVSRC